MCDDPLSNVRERVRKHAKQYSNEIDCTCIGVCKQEPTFSLQSIAFSIEDGRAWHRCYVPQKAAMCLAGSAATGLAVVTGLEWVRDAERCWCGATCPLRRRHTCRPRWWALLYQRPHLSCSSSPPVPSPSPPMTMATCMRTAPSCSRAASGGQLEQRPQLCCVRMSALQWRQGCVGVALC